ncbi:glycine oxidase ThiO [Rhizobium sp. C1]|uniref:glycine oxidase ThiO n=1 Tax=Rhizobium sp. C1 TaxID=1349799 RepID=UPI001E55BD7A|nr:glycine oxidase ThiO [Rhizobium sp. C1]MCD2177974.1 glycine oxidase ThiO [Rhizobium sp. C1]
MTILVKGAGVAGLTAAFALARKGHPVTLLDPKAPGVAASHYAGGMLAPWCEGETAPEVVVEAGAQAIGWWECALPGLVERKGTLVVAPPRDQSELERFARRTHRHEWVDEAGIAELEPALAGRFRRALFFRDEAHLDPRKALAGLFEALVSMGAKFLHEADDRAFCHIIDCTGRAAIVPRSQLRGVRGEMLYLTTQDLTLSRPVRLLHPRIPLYVVPRGDGRFMVGATMIESEHDGPISVRSLMELLNAAYTLHPTFGEAEVIETGTSIRPAYADNIPRITGSGRHLAINGMYRHGFLMAPALAQELAARFEAEPQRRSATA